MKQISTIHPLTAACLAPLCAALRRAPLCAALCLVLLASCSEDTLPFGTTAADIDSTEAIVFVPTTVEQIELQYAYGATRAAVPAASPSGSAAAVRRANTPGSRPFEGDASGLHLHRMPLPFVEIHPRTAAAPATAAPGSQRLRYYRNPSNPSNPSNPATRASAAPGTAAAPATRASAATDIATSSNFHSSMTVWGYISAATPSHDDATLFNRVLINKVNNWRTSVHWPYDGDNGGSRTMRFYAIAPSIEDLELTLTNTPAFATAPTFTYRVPDDPAEQLDLLFGISTNGGQTGEHDKTTESSDIEIAKGPITGGDYIDDSWSREDHLGKDDKTVDLQFRHILTAIRFVQGNIPTNLRITSITLNSIKNRGTYNAGTSAWTIDDASTGHYTIDVSYTPTNYTEGSNVYIDGGNVLFLMPHTCTSGAELEVALTDTNGTPDNTADDRNHTIKVSLSGDVWMPGYTVTYKVAVGELRGDYYLAVEKGSDGATTTLENDVNAHDVTTGTFKVHSYRMFQDYSSSEGGTATGPSHPIHWKVNAIYKANSDGTRSATVFDESPAWLQALTGWNVQGHSGVAVDGGENTGASYTFNAASGSVYSHAGILKNNTEPASLWDLSKMKVVGSTYTITTSPSTTANCYIINKKAGSYTFPMVYGNGLVEGNPNVSGTTCVDHEGDIITTPYILDQLNKTKTVTSDNVTTVTETNYGTDGTTFGPDYSDVTAEILWQSEDGLVHSLSQNFGGNTNASYIGFSAGDNDGTHVKPANCIIALKGKKRTRTRTKTTDVSKVSESTTEPDGTTTTTTGDLESGEYPRTQTTTEITIASGTKTTTTTTVTQNDWSAWSVANDYDNLWFWHIWMTDEIYPNREQTGKTVGSTVLRNSSGTEQYKIMPVNLGWVPASDSYTVYEHREAWIEIVQCASDGSALAGSGNPCYVKISQLAQQTPEEGTSLTFQWGFPVTASGTPAATWTHAGAWSTTKTLYDPCPPGYQLPPPGLFTGDVTASNGNGTGWFFFPQAGISTGAQKLRQGLFYLPFGNYWSSDATPTAITLGSDGTLGTSTPGASTALPIRPVGSWRE
ncbi:MAG: fimbrillin family protein [Bacteroidaceae bacterium]|nr:fimbrillin family protein [Bacteroidaceae bacterium]